MHHEVVVPESAGHAQPPHESRPTQIGEAQFRDLVECAPDAIVVTADGDGRIVLVNRQAEAMFGYHRDELLGRPIEVLIPERLRSEHVEQRNGRRIGRHARPMGVGLSLYARRKDGSEFPVDVSLSPLQAGDGVVITSCIRDISEHRRREAELAALLARERDLERHKDEFLANVSHDLRTPIAAIKASIGVVLAHEPPGMPEPLHRMFVNIDLATDRLTGLVADLLTLTRLQAGRVQLRLGRCDLRALALRSAASIEPLAQSRAQRVLVEVPADPFVVVADADRLERALLNLLGNAHKYGSDGGMVRLGLERRGGDAVFAVTDDGPGIPEDEQERIFERFYRSETEATRRNQGSGLGLPIARAMVELHDGRIWVESRPGAGTTFLISLPADRPA